MERRRPPSARRGRSIGCGGERACDVGGEAGDLFTFDEALEEKTGAVLLEELSSGLLERGVLLGGHFRETRQ